MPCLFDTDLPLVNDEMSPVWLTVLVGHFHVVRTSTFQKLLDYRFFHFYSS